MADLILLLVLLGFIWLLVYLSRQPNRYCRTFFKFLPLMVACYSLPSLLNTFELIDLQQSALPKLAQQWLMPMALLLSLLSLDLKLLWYEGRRLLGFFLIGSIGVVLGAPSALLAMGQRYPQWLTDIGAESVWRGMVTLSANWVGGTANQMAMKSVYQAGDDIFGIFVTVNVVVSGIWTAVLLMLVPHAQRLGLSAATPMKSQPPTEQQRLTLPQLGIGAVLLAVSVLLMIHLARYLSGCFAVSPLDQQAIWLVLLTTMVGVCCSFYPTLAAYGQQFQQWSNRILYLMLAIIGLQMDISVLFEIPAFFILGCLWLLVHILVLYVAVYCCRGSFQDFAIASQCNLGGAASAPVIAQAFSSKLIPLSLVIAIFGYAWANVMAVVCAKLLQQVLVL